MQIQQGSQKAIIDWSSFNIGKDAAVTFQQPDTSAIALNRVTAGDASHIHGQLNANGQVWLINPNGIVFGQGSQVDVGGLVASTMNITNADFENGHYSFTRNGTTGSITNLGELTAKDGGSIALLAPTVSNDGILRAQLGTVAMAAGDKITLQAGANGLLHVEIDPATIRTLVENKQLIVADGGQVIMTGKAADQLSSSVVSNTGTIQANRLQEKDGKILLIADMQHGETHAAGTLEAHFIDTSAATVSIDQDLHINTAGGQWLIDPVDITIDQNKATAIQNALGTGNVTISTADGANNGSLGTNGTGTDKGDIHVNADITYTQNKLTLNADNDINLNAAIHVNGSGTLDLRHGNTGATGLKVSGAVNFAQAGAGLLTVNGAGYTVIKDAAALQAINNDKSRNYALGGDVDASGSSFTPIGGNFGSAFSGIFDGLGHRISGLQINSNLEAVGLFGRTQNAVLRNVELEGGSVTGLVGANAVGALVGSSMAWEAGAGIFNVSASTAVTGARNVGGLVGSLSDGSISNAHASGAVTGSFDATGPNPGRLGGLVGRIDSSTSANLTNVYASGAVKGQGGRSDYAGGLVGLASTGYAGTLHITNAYATGNVRTEGQYVGGLIGGIDSNGGAVELRNLHASGSVVGNGAGGVIGFGRGTQPISLYAWWDTDSTGQPSSIGHSGSDFNGVVVTTSAADRYSHDRYADFGDWTETAPSSGIWQASDSNGVQWIMIEGRTRPFLASEYSTTIRNAHQLQLMAYDLGGSYRLAGDIDTSATSTAYGAGSSGMWSSRGFSPVGTWGNGANFTGALDGQGHSIQRLTIQSADSFAGLFGLVGSGAQIRNVGLADARVEVSSGSGSHQVGALVGHNAGSISNSWVSGGNIKAASNGVQNEAGGLVGQNTGGSISDSHALASVTVQGDATRNYAGGLVGHSNGGSIERSYATGSAVSDGGVYGHAGGLAGALSGGGTVHASHATGNATVKGVINKGNLEMGTFAGGLVGWSSGSINASYASGNAWAHGILDSGPISSMRNTAGGLAGYNEGGIYHSYASGNATLNITYSFSYDYAGGLVGYNTGTLNSVYATGRAGFERSDAYPYAGGLVGGNSSGVIANAYYATTDAAGSTINNGGATGRVYGPKVEWSGNAYGSAKTYTELMNSGLYTGGWDSSIWNLPKGEAGEGYEIGLPALTGVTRPQDVVRSTWFDGGWGTADSAYGIANWGQLSNMRLLLDKHYRLNDDLDSQTSGYAQHASATANGGAGFKPIGADLSTPFTGTLDGQGHAISDLVVKTSGTGLVYAGLFGAVSGGAKISNLGLVNATVSASGGSHNYAGALAGFAIGQTDISHSYASGGSVATRDASVVNYVGGLIGFLNGPILTDSYACNEISTLSSGSSAYSYAGGLAGYGISSYIKRSYATGMVGVSGGGQRNYAGGLIGYIEFGSIASSYASGNVSAADGSENYAGGLVGGHWGGISQSYATGSVSAIGNVQAAGGLVGASSSGAKSNHSFYATTDAGGNAINNGGVAAGEWSSNALGTPKTWDELKQASTFAAWGSDLATNAGSSAIWRIYDGNTLPLLRSWLKPKTVTVSVQGLPTDIEYNGAAISGSLTASGHDGGSAVQGDLNTTLSYSTTSKNAGTYSTQDGSLQLIGSGLYSDQQGYDIAYGLDTALVIQPKALTVSGTTVADKTYDGNKGAEVSLGTVSGWVNDERLNISAIGTFDNKNAGTAKQVEVAYTLNDGSNGGLASNYRLTDGNSYTAAIEPKALTITATNASKTQGEILQLNGSTGFVVGSGLVDGESIDQVELASPGTGAEADAGAHDIIASAASGSNGFDADNYTITYQKGTLTVIASSGSGTGGNPGDNGGGSNPGDNGGGSNPGDNGGGGNPGDNGGGSNPGDNGGGSNPGDNGGGGNPGDNGGGSNPGDNGSGGNPGDNGSGDNPGDNGGGSNPGDNGGGGNPGDNGSGGNPGDNGGGSSPGDNGSGGNPGDNGGGSNPGDNGGGSNPGDNGGGSNPGDNGGGSNPGDNGTGGNPGDSGSGGNPGDTGGTSEGESARQPNVPILSGGALWLAQQTTEDERLARNRRAALESQREDRVPYLTLTPEFIRLPGPEGGGE